MARLLLAFSLLLITAAAALPSSDPPPRWVGSQHGVQQEEVLAWARREFVEDGDPISQVSELFITHPWVNQYAALHSSIVQRRAPVEAQRFVVWRCSASKRCAGWANRVTGILSALAFAILSERALVIEWPDTGDLALENYVRSDFIDWRVPEWLAQRSTPYSHDSILIIDRVFGTGMELTRFFKLLNPAYHRQRAMWIQVHIRPALFHSSGGH